MPSLPRDGEANHPNWLKTRAPGSMTSARIIQEAPGVREPGRIQECRASTVPGRKMLERKEMFPMIWNDRELLGHRVFSCKKYDDIDRQPDDAGKDFEQYGQLFGKHLDLDSRRDSLANEKGKREQARKRAKRANEILRNMCRSAGLPPFFFDRFLVWSDYVEGKLNEEEFIEIVREEVEKKAQALQN